MNDISRFFSRFERRSLLIAAAVLLLLLNLGRWAAASYQARQVELESNTARLEQYLAVTEKTEELENRLEQLLRQKGQVEKYFFSGETADKIASAMQIRIQSMVTKSGLQSESIRPLRQGKDEGRGKDEAGQPLGEVLIKARLAGTLSQFMDFVAEIYRGREFFKIENFSLKPYKNSGLKIFVELRGYYIQPAKESDTGGGSET